MEKILENVDP